MFLTSDDKRFLKELDRQINKEIFVKIIALDFDEAPLETIEGRATGGSVNISGGSTIARTCSLNLVAEKVNVTDYYWTLNSKFKLEIGVGNTVDLINHPPIIWFEQGIFVINSFNCSVGTNNYSISISGKDKMVLLNGEVGGVIQYETNFSKINIIDENDNITEEDIPVKDIIKNVVHEFAREPLSNIIINDVPDYGYKLETYRGSTPLYIIYSCNTNNSWTFEEIIKPYQATMGREVYNQKGKKISIDKLSGYYKHNPFIKDGEEPQVFYLKNNTKRYVAAKFEKGSVVGYSQTPLTYADGDEKGLVGAVGATITNAVLEKIVTMLGEYEYFYNTKGQFVFQRKPTYINHRLANLFDTGQRSNEEDNSIQTNAPYIETSGLSYDFRDSDIITQISSTPAINNLKNDFSVWGTRKGISGADIPIHIRYAVDKKPEYYKSYDEKEFMTKNCEFYNSEKEVFDWRELLYQMAKDYFKYQNSKDDFRKVLRANNQYKEENGIMLKDYYPTGYTGYEQYYTDIAGFWRQIYNPNSTEEDFYHGKDEDYTGCWNINMVEEPESLVFWFDFLDTEGELKKFSVKNIGSRPKAESDSEVTSIYYATVPELLFLQPNEELTTNNAYQKITLTDNLKDLFYTSGRAGVAALDKINDLVYNNTCCAESISLTALPIFYLEPNTKIHIDDAESGLKGDYVVNSVGFSLAYNGTMNISATKVVDILL